MTKCIIRTCRAEFIKRSMTHKACSPECAAEYAKRERVKKERKEIRARKAAIKPRSAWLKDAQAAFNAYIRERDKARPCICCGQPLTVRRSAEGMTVGTTDLPGVLRICGLTSAMRTGRGKSATDGAQVERWITGLD